MSAFDPVSHRIDSFLQCGHPRSQGLHVPLTSMYLRPALLYLSLARPSPPTEKAPRQSRQNLQSLRHPMVPSPPPCPRHRLRHVRKRRGCQKSKVPSRSPLTSRNRSVSLSIVPACISRPSRLHLGREAEAWHSEFPPPHGNPSRSDKGTTWKVSLPRLRGLPRCIGQSDLKELIAIHPASDTTMRPILGLSEGPDSRQTMLSRVTVRGSLLLNQ
ncbi:hypothetical protein BKA70DRAFT_1325154 [Coprinopsis sp. MPI-PUGE-AT-0042]|nr:hypothetical protein BKA70DRAFT_1325154 [Coprinopsis sp. MPI-PUGE-AT-0042]